MQEYELQVYGHTGRWMHVRDVTGRAEAEKALLTYAKSHSDQFRYRIVNKASGEPVLHAGKVQA